RRRILLRRMNSDGRIHAARPTADKQHPGLAGQPRLPERHKARTALMTAGHDLDGGLVIQTIEHTQIALTRHAKNALDLMRNQTLHKQIGSTNRHLWSPNQA